MLKCGLRVFCVVLGLLVMTMLPLLGVLPQVEANSPYFRRFETFIRYVQDPPHGDLNLRVFVYKLMSDGNPNYDWYAYHVRLQTVPGRIIYGSPWVTHHTCAVQDVWEPDVERRRWLDDYDPTTTSGATTVSVSLTGGKGGATAGLGWSYAISDVAVLDKSCLARHWARWEHCINEEAPVGRHTYLSRPGFVVKTREGAWSRVNASYKVWWEHDVWWWDHDSVEIPSILLDVIYPPPPLPSPLVVRIAGSCTVKKIAEASEIPFEALYPGTDLQIE